MSHSGVPTFGNWENEINVSYKDYLDSARKIKGWKVIYPNDTRGGSYVKPISTRPESTSAPRAYTAEESVRPNVPPLYNPPARNRNMDQSSLSYYSHVHIPVQCRRPSPGFEINFVMPERSAGVPKFGDWDENPSVHENLSNIYRLCAEKDAAPSPAPASAPKPTLVSSTPKHTFHIPDNQPSNKQKTCCFPWKKVKFSLA